MRLPLNARASGRRLTLTPLIDVIFLLLLFFMLTSTVAEFAEIELVGGRSGEGSASASPIFLQLQGERVRINGEDAALHDVSERLERFVGTGRQTVLLSLDDEATSQAFVDVYAIVRSVPNLSVVVIE